MKKYMDEKWDYRFLGLAKYISQWSKDPSTQTGAVIVDHNQRVVSIGYNGFPRGIKDDERLEDREAKYRIIVHCERNALLFANRSLENCALYTYPMMSCSVCAAMVIQSGIIRCVAPEANEEKLERWGDDFIIAKDLFREAGVQLDLYRSS